MITTEEQFNALKWDEQDREMDNVNRETKSAVVCAILKQACSALNHEDERYVPAIEYAIRYMERGHDIELGMGDEPLDCEKWRDNEF